jgi:hypothetical protein
MKPVTPRNKTKENGERRAMTTFLSGNGNGGTLQHEKLARPKQPDREG